MGDGKQLDFDDITAQTNYFKGKTQFTYTDYNYQRQDRAITVSIPGGVDALMNCNYVMYQNKNFTNKWFYAFITRKEWVSENAARLYLKTDVFQTWLFDFKLMPSVVEREHTPTDNYYEHTLPENLETGEIFEINRSHATTYSTAAANQNTFDSRYRCIVCTTTLWTATATTSDMLGGTPRSIYYYGFSRADLPRAIRDIVQNIGADAILCVYAVPINALSWYEYHTEDWTYYVPHDRSNADERTFYMPPRAEVQGMGNVKNKKCFCYPYHYYALHDMAGHSVTLAPQNFYHANQGTFTIRNVFNGAPSPALTSIPLYYRNLGIGAQIYAEESTESAVTFKDFPELAYKTDFFQNYLALNKAKITVNAAALGMSAMKPSPAQIAQSADSAINVIANMIDMQKIPDRANGNIGGNLLMLCGNTGIFLSEYRIKDEYLRIIDNYFTMFGYKVMTLKTPQFKSRPLFNYLKTAGIDISGNIPQEDLQELRTMFDNGITVWHSGDNFGNYTGDNSPS